MRNDRVLAIQQHQFDPHAREQRGGVTAALLA
jgi:hypothetical protein